MGRVKRKCPSEWFVRKQFPHLLLSPSKGHSQHLDDLSARLWNSIDKQTKYSTWLLQRTAVMVDWCQAYRESRSVHVTFDALVFTLVSHWTIEITRKLMSFVEDVLVLMNSKPDTKRRKDSWNIHSIAQGMRIRMKIKPFSCETFCTSTRSENKNQTVTQKWKLSMHMC